MHKSVREHTKKLIFSALMVAMSVVIGLFCKNYLTFGGAIRITFENIPVLLTGLLLGPLYGGAVGITADLITAPSTGSINPIITLGAALIGIISGLLGKYVFCKESFINRMLCILPAHIIGSMLVKSFGLWYFYGYALELCLARIPLYFGIALVESYIIYIILKNKRGLI